MSGATWLAFAAASAVGAPLRHIVDTALQGRVPGPLPLGTLAVNVSGSFFFGVVTGLALHHGLDPEAKRVLGAGLCGSYTTFSTFSVDVVSIAQGGDPATSLRYVASTLVAGVVAAALGLTLTAI